MQSVLAHIRQELTPFAPDALLIRALDALERYQAGEATIEEAQQAYRPLYAVAARLATGARGDIASAADATVKGGMERKQRRKAKRKGKRGDKRAVALECTRVVLYLAGAITAERQEAAEYAIEHALEALSEIAPGARARLEEA